MMPTIRALGNAALDVIFPPVCSACPEIGMEPFCPLCAEALLDAEPFEVEHADGAQAVWAYGGPAALAIQSLKYEGRIELGRPLGNVLAAKLDGMPPIDGVVPVPLTKERLRERGYNQARELVRGLALPVWHRALVRTSGPTQVGLDRAARLANLEGHIRPGPTSVQDRSVLLVDDVVTTGATASASARVLRQAGASHVWVLSLAYTSGSL